MCARGAVLPKEFHEKYVGGNRMAIFIAMMVSPATTCNYEDGIARYNMQLHHTRHAGRRQCSLHVNGPKRERH
jgi:hypothetical protein